MTGCAGGRRERLSRVGKPALPRVSGGSCLACPHKPCAAGAAVCHTGHAVQVGKPRLQGAELGGG